MPALDIIQHIIKFLYNLLNFSNNKTEKFLKIGLKRPRPGLGHCPRPIFSKIKDFLLKFNFYESFSMYLGNIKEFLFLHNYINFNFLYKFI